MKNTNAPQGMRGSVLSFPDRGPWGRSSYRGNCSGYVYRDLFRQLKPATFCDPMVGSGTSVEVAREMGIEAHGLDLRLGFNALRDSILQAIGGRPADLVLSHPPYGPMVRYSGEVWGDKAHPDDLSWCADDEDFHAKLQAVLLNQRDATAAGGHYGTIIGDLRSGGRYVSYQAEAIARMPQDELVAVLIKQQHNCVSDAQRYASMRYPRVLHEYVLLWRKRERRTFELLRGIAGQAAQRLRNTWKAIVHLALLQAGGRASMAQIYALVHEAAPQRCEANSNWQAKVRQTLQLGADRFRNVERGIWALTEAAPKASPLAA